MPARFEPFLHADLLRAHGLDSLDAVRALKGPVFKVQPGRRDVLRLRLVDAAGQPITLFIKRSFVSYPHNERMSLLRYGRVLGTCEIEGRHLRTLESLGVRVSPCVATGAETSLLKERYSFIITQGLGGMPLDDWLDAEPCETRRRAVLRELARTLRRLHDRRYGLPTLLARHVFVDFDGETPRLTLIDIDRLARPPLMHWRRAKDLSHLDLSVAVRKLPRSERLRFLCEYAPRRQRRRLLAPVRRRSAYLLLKRKERSAPYFKGLRSGVIQDLLAQARRDRRPPAAFYTTLGAIGSVLLGVMMFGLDSLYDSDWFQEEVVAQLDEWTAMVQHFQRDHAGTMVSALVVVILSMVAVLIGTKSRQR